MPPAPTAQNSTRGRRARRAALQDLRFRMETPPGFLAWGTRAPIQQWKERGRPGPFPPSPLGFLQRTRSTAPCAPALHSAPLLSPQVPPNSSREAPQNPDDAPKLPGHWPAAPIWVLRTLLVAFFPPRTALLAFMGSQTQTTRKRFARSLPAPALLLKQKRREEGGGRGGGRKV